MERRLRSEHVHYWLKYFYRVRGPAGRLVDSDEILDAIPHMPDELVEYIAKSSEWNKEFKVAAEKVLQDRIDCTLLGASEKRKPR